MTPGIALLIAAFLAALLAGWGAGWFMVRGPWHGLVRLALVVGTGVALFYAAFALGIAWETRSSPPDATFGHALGDFARNAAFGTLAGVQAALLALCGWTVGLVVGLFTPHAAGGER